MLRRRSWRLALCLACASVAVASPVAALTFARMDYTCPVGGERFSQNLPASGTSFGVHLDMKPYGALIAPWPLPVCPGNGFVIYKEEAAFTADELRRLSEYVASDAYRDMVKTDSPYFRAAMLMRVAEGDNAPVAPLLLQATWETEGDARYPRYAEAALAAYRADAAADTSTGAAADMSAITRHLLAGELLRRLSRFDEANAEFLALESRLGSDAEDIVREVLRFQRTLVAQRDALPHRVPEIDVDTDATQVEPAPPQIPSEDAVRAAEIAADAAAAANAAEAAAEAAADAAAADAAAADAAAAAAAAEAAREDTPRQPH